MVERRTERIDALTDGVFAIAATLLVLEVRVPELHEHGAAAVWQSLLAVAPSFVAFAFSFVTILLYWLNHHSLSRVIAYYPYRLVWLNLVLLLWISMIPFTTKFISEYPTEPVALFTYGLVMSLTATTAIVSYCYAAFWTQVMDERVSMDTRRALLWRWGAAPIVYLIAALASFVNVYVAIAVYLAVPMAFFVPALQERTIADLTAEDDAHAATR